MRLVSFLALLCAAVSEPVRYRSYDEMVAKLAELGGVDDDVRVYSAQKEFGLPSPGPCGSKPCETWIVEIGPVDENAPEVFVSGEIHGDERIGPIAVMETIELMLHSKDPWISFLRRNRRTVFVPTTNSLGFYRNTREELGMDTNRDYPVDLRGSSKPCMSTVTSRVVNELFRRHLFRLALTFHGGMRAIAYEWGTVSHKKDSYSPDANVQNSIGAVLAAYAGGESFYPHGTMNRIVYPVRGGMEDWAYGASWDSTSKSDPCEPSTFGGYSKSKTTYDSDALRCLTMLVETSDSKSPNVEFLGDSKDFFVVQTKRPGKSGIGHVPRNVRVILATIDLVDPYVVILGVDEKNRVSVDLGGAFEFESLYVDWYDSENTQLRSDLLKSNVKTRWTQSTQIPVVKSGGTFSLANINRPFTEGFSFDLPVRPANAYEMKIRAINPDDSLADAAPESHFSKARFNAHYRAKAMESSNEIRGSTQCESEAWKLGEIAEEERSSEKVDDGSFVIPDKAPYAAVAILSLLAMVTIVSLYSKKKSSHVDVTAEPEEKDALTRV